MSSLDEIQVVKLYLNKNYEFKDNVLSFTFSTSAPLDKFREIIGDIKMEETGKPMISFKGSNIIDILGMLYSTSCEGLHDPLYKILYNISHVHQDLTCVDYENKLPSLIWFRNDRKRFLQLKLIIVMLDMI